MALIKGKQLEADTVTQREADTANGAISTVNGGDAAAEGSGTGLARRDHQHAVATAAPGTVAVGDSAAEGAAADLARSDHTHAVTAPGAPANVTKAAAAAGASADVARADHKHDVTTAAPVSVGTANAEGAATTLARSNHVHDHGAQTAEGHHALATPSLDGFMSAEDKTKLDSAQDLDAIDAKESCRVRAQGNLTLSGEQTIDGILTSANRILVDQQSTGSQDGIYVTAAGAWARATDAPIGAEARGWRVWIEEGTADGDRLYACSNNQGSDIVGTDGLVFGLIGAGSPRGAGAGTVLNGNDIDVVANGDGSLVVAANDMRVGVLATDAQHGVRGGGTQHALAVASTSSGFISGAELQRLEDMATGAEVNDTPRQEAVTTQTVTAADTALTDVLNNIPLASAASLLLHLNGVYQKQGAGFDYTVNITTGAITWLASTGTAVDMETTDTLDASYLS